MGAGANTKEAKFRSDSEDPDVEGFMGGSSSSSARPIQSLRAEEYQESGWYKDDGRGAWDWKERLLRVPEGPVNRKRQEQELTTSDEAQEPGCPAFDAETWLEMAENGELDIYSCLSLSDGNSLNEDTRKLLAKISMVLVLQLMVPFVMLYLQLAQGCTFRPRIPDIAFRIVGFALYLYSLYSMYNNALDECRNRFLRFAFDNKLSSGYWWPLVLGEFSNTMVSLVLVFTLFFIYTNSTNSVDLILNAVAVNFLGSVDADMVNNEMMKDGVENFKEIMTKFPGGGSRKGSTVGKVTNMALRVMLASIVFSGTVLAFTFLILESPESPIKLGTERE